MFRPLLCLYPTISVAQAKIETAGMPETPVKILFEYDWSVDEDRILSHAVQAAEVFGLELEFGTVNDPVHQRSVA